MRDLHKAIAVVVICCLALGGILVAAALKQRPRLTSQELLGATRVAVDDAVALAVKEGGLQNAEDHVERGISTALSSVYGIETDARIARLNDFEEMAAFYFDVVAGELSVRFRLDGVRDPLLAMRLNLDWRWREDPNHPYEVHGDSAMMSECLNNHYFHQAADAPDFFARLENKTEDPYHSGVEMFLVIDGRIVIDHLWLGGRGTIDSSHRKYYGLP